MAVLSDVDLRKAIKEDEGIIIVNRREKSITAVGYDLTIGFICDADSGDIPETCETDENRYVLLQGHRYLIISKEYLSFSGEYMATIHSRASYAMKGLIMSSTTVDPNYAGCIHTTLINGTTKAVNIKKDNQFATLVIHTLRTPTDSYLQKNDRGMPMDAQETYNSKYSTFPSEVSKNAMIYEANLRQKIKYEYEAAKKRMHEKAQKRQNSAESAKKRMQEEAQKQQDAIESARRAEETQDKPLQTESKKSFNGGEEEKKKNITFLIGNGFDINVGLDTRYTDFYGYYIKNNKDDMLAKEIRSDYDNWADLEFALGQYTQKVNKEDEDGFWYSEGALERQLGAYLSEQMSKVKFDETKDKEIAYKIQESLEKFYKSFSETNKIKLKDTLESTSNNIVYSFISFNYTDILDKCLEAVKGIHFPYIGAHRDCNNVEYNHMLGEVLHIHGEVGDEMVLGVNDESQIANTEFRKDELSRQALIKKETNKRYGNIKFEKACHMIDNSIIICIFGMSIGKTDKIWWQYIAEWLRGNQDRKLVIYDKENDERRLFSKYNEFWGKDETLKKFRNNAAVEDGAWEQIKDQIYIAINADMFQFRLV